MNRSLDGWTSRNKSIWLNCFAIFMTRNKDMRPSKTEKLGIWTECINIRSPYFGIRHYHGHSYWVTIEYIEFGRRDLEQNAKTLDCLKYVAIAIQRKTGLLFTRIAHFSALSHNPNIASSSAMEISSLGTYQAWWIASMITSKASSLESKSGVIFGQLRNPARWCESDLSCRISWDGKRPDETISIAWQLLIGREVSWARWSAGWSELCPKCQTR
jgi:hypothetical protein